MHSHFLCAHLYLFFFTFSLHGFLIYSVDEPILQCQIPWSDDNELLAAWREARTGYPWIDAIMVQVRSVFKLLNYFLSSSLNCSYFTYVKQEACLKLRYVALVAQQVGLDAPFSKALCCLFSNSWRSGMTNMSFSLFFITPCLTKTFLLIVCALGKRA